ncbi:SUMF1/EgtB/PvdO family nonheme iron enzyme [Pseudoalteromonas sp. SR44-2]|uniref:SUMF1/EgtB/PvdO family nonheme iron enzyme n=1 Tax=Pseudoalteromonas sp. SR44-2 TaxID=2760937 RepID=UPI0016019FCA|nr:SUMF1/EgtB/PvdO family nonheme iron enzyme [Pseudoalteromonas sp. SR44-2]MBB1338182.1 SUMF1/EgtB/PvdO family nonheme iron enzyme [Pseudoalteromonas sp. SR44-2]
MSIEQINEIVSAADRVVTAIESKAAEIDNKTAQLASDYSSKKTALEQQIVESSAELAIVASAGYRKAIEDASGGRNTVVIDEQGNPNVMVRIPRFNYEDLNQAIFDRLGVDLMLGTGTPTMFQRNGEQMGEVLIAKYLASVGANGGCSVIGGVQPRTSVNYNVAKALCNNKGDGWHMMSIHEWAAIALWSLANDSLPRGNTNFGRSHEKKLETARRADNGMPGDSSGLARTDTGKGPVTWAHDHTEWGIQDLVGNVWEWLDQMMLDEGQIVTTLDNNPGIVEENWVKQAAWFDSPEPNSVGTASAGSPILSASIINRNGPIGSDEHNNPYLTNNHFAGIAKSDTYQKAEILRRLLIESESTDTVKGYLTCRNYGKRFPLRGGYWHVGSSAGLGAINLNHSRLYEASSFSFRPAFFA